MLKLSMVSVGSEKLARAMQQLATGRIREEAAAAMNIVAHKHIVPAMKQELQKFDRVTPFVERSVRLVKAATPADVTIEVGPSYNSQLGTKGGKVGVDPQQVLQAQQFGGKRRDKRSEKLLKLHGWLRADEQTFLPSELLGGSGDGYGNLRGSFVQQLLAYLQAFQLKGSSSNMGKSRMADVHAGRARAMGKKRREAFVGPMQGRRYFVARGQHVQEIVGGESTRMVWRGRPNKHLAPGIYAAIGPGGRTLKPVLYFGKEHRYQPKVDLSMRAVHAQLQDQVARTFRARVYEAVEKAARA